MHQFCFYLDWAGWPPEVWAAWVQAIGSILAIVAAWSLASRQERKALARKVDVYVNLISMAESRSHRLSTFAPTGIYPFGSGGTVNDQQIRDFEQFASAFRSVALQDVPDFRLLPVIRDAQTACDALAELLGQITPENARLLNKESFQRRARIQHCTVRLRKAYEEAAEIANEYAAPTLTQRLSYAAFKLRSWRNRDKH